MEGKATAHAMMDQARNAAIHLLAQCGKQFQGGVASNIGKSQAGNKSFVAAWISGECRLNMI